METRVLTMMLTDIKGFTQRTSATSRQALGQLLDEHERILYPIFRHYRGTLVKTIGDALLITFESPTNAVLCGLAMQEHLRLRNQDQPEEDHLNIRIAINSGEVQLRGGDVFGEAVNITARIEGITEVGEIYFTESVYLAMNKSEVPSSEVGHKRLKGLPEAIKVYKVMQDPHSEQFRQLQEDVRGLELDEGASVDTPPSDIGVADGRTPAGKTAPPPPRPRRRLSWPLAGGVAAVLVAAVAIAAYLLRDPLASDIATFEEAVAAKDYPRASTLVDRLLREFPGEARAHQSLIALVAARVGDLAEAKAFAKAIKLIDSSEETYQPRTFDTLRKQTLLAMGAHRAKDWTYRDLAPVYGSLLDRYADDPEILRVVMDVMGAAAPDGPTRLAHSAALIAIEREDFPVDQVTAMLTLDFLITRATDPYSKNGRKFRRLLRERYSEAEALARAEWAKSECRRQVHGYLILSELKRLSVSDRLRFSFTMLRERCRGVSNLKSLVAEAVRFIDDNAGRPDWAALKRDAGIGAVAEVSAIRRGGYYTKPAAAGLLKGFLPEIQAVLHKALVGAANRASEEDMARTNAWHMLAAAEAEPAVPPWEFHRQTLLRYGGRFRPAIVKQAIDYMAGHPDRAAARQILEQARAHFSGLRQAEIKRGEADLDTHARHYLAVIEAALAN